MFEKSTVVKISYAGGPVYRVHYLDDHNLTWECLEGDDKGRNGHETCTRRRIAEGIWQVNWVESEGIAVVQVIQPDIRTITTTIVIPTDLRSEPDVLILEGVFAH